MIERISLMAGLLALGVACGEAPCEDYVDYMCACHGDDSGFSCADLERVYGDSDPTVQDQCQIDLAEQKDEDEASGESCEA